MTTSRMVSVQLIKIHWDKSQRGPHFGAMRKALPRILPFEPPSQASPDTWHSVTFDGRFGYNLASSWLSKTKGGESGWRNPYPISAKQEGEFLRVGLGRDLNLGKMRARSVRRTLARIPFGRRVAIYFNDAHDGHHQRLYYEYAINVGFAESPTLDLPLFREIDMRRLLY